MYIQQKEYLQANVAVATCNLYIYLYMHVYVIAC